MALHPLAGKIAPQEVLVNLAQLENDYFAKKPDANNPLERVAFGTSGHRGTSLESSFNEDHILAITQAVCDYRKKEQITGPLYIGIDSHLLSRFALYSALEVLAANEMLTLVQSGLKQNKLGYTPTPVISHAILTYNKNRQEGFADGIVITPSHNPPRDGGFKYNPPHGGPAGTEVTSWIENRANELLLDKNQQVKRKTNGEALRSNFIKEYDFIIPYINDLSHVIDMDVIRHSGLKIGADPMGGSNLEYWDPIRNRYQLNLDVVNRHIDHQFAFMTLDKDGKIRMDCSSPYAMASLVKLKDQYDIAFGNDTDSDRHGIVTCSGGLMNPNHYLSVAINYLFTERKQWPGRAQIGKTVVSSSMIDRVAKKLGRGLSEVPVGFKWFVEGLISGDFGFGGEESAGASFLRKDGTVWTTDKDGIILDLLAAEIMAKTGQDPYEHYQVLTREFGTPVYERIDIPATVQIKDALKNIRPDHIKQTMLAGEKVLHQLTQAPGNGAAIGGLKMITENGWFAARPSGTENIYKIYLESFLGDTHLQQIRSEAETLIADMAKAK